MKLLSSEVGKGMLLLGPVRVCHTVAGVLHNLDMSCWELAIYSFAFTFPPAVSALLEDVNQIELDERQSVVVLRNIVIHNFGQLILLSRSGVLRLIAPIVVCKPTANG